MRIKRTVALGLSVATAASLIAGCSNSNGSSNTKTGLQPGKEYSDDEIIEMTMFTAMPGSEINSNNDIQNIIAKKTGVKVKETWLTGQTDAEAIGTMIAGGDYTDFINGGDAMMALYDEGCLIAWDEYIDKYPNIKEMYSDKEWERFRQEDGHIYWANVFNNTLGEDKTTDHGGEAFWIQVRVLEWAGYPTITTLDEYFDVLERYAAANPTMEDGTKNITYTALCDDWRYFCIENAPEFLDGYPNDGSVIVDKTNMKIVDYNTTPTAKKYFQKLNEEYNKGVIDPEFATQTYDEYIAKLSTGCVLGMCDQWWDFAYTINPVLKSSGLSDQGCDYVPCGLTIESGMDNRWHDYGDTLNESSGVAITKNCKNVDAAFQFLNDLLDQEIHDLRFWGVEGTDYLVDADGLYYRTDDMRAQWDNTEYKASHECSYSYMPQWNGTSRDGKNAMMPGQQTSEFFNGKAEPLLNCFKAYNATTYVDMVGSVVEEQGPWYPMYSFSNNMTTSTPGGVSWVKMGETKHKWLPKVVMASDFESEWENYMKDYEACEPQNFLDEMQAELDKRAGK